MEKKIYTDSGIEINPLYRAENNGINKENPGEFPFTRGIYGEMYRSKRWIILQNAGFGTSAENNKRYRHLLAKGVSCLGVAFDLPTQIGYDSDHILAEGEVGKVGVPIDSIRDMEELFDGISLDKITTSMTINATGFIQLAFYTALAKQQGVDLKKISGTIQNDILKEYIVRGSYIYPPQHSIRIITDMFEWCGRELPKWNTISISGYHIREAGSTAVQEIAFTLANGKAYVKAAIEYGLDINVFGKRLSFFFNAHNNLFEEVAKFRAARRIWAHIMRDLGATDPEAMMMRFHVQTSASTLTAQQPLNNITRVTIQAISAILGGTQSLYTSGYNEGLGMPTDEATELAIRTQEIIGCESGIAETADPLGGSFFVESLTASIEKAAIGLVGRIDDMGGSVSAIEQGFIQNEIAKSALEYQLKVENKEKIIVGLNAFESNDIDDSNVFRIDDSIRDIQIQKLNTLKRERDPAKCDQMLQLLNDHASSGENLMPAVIKAIEAKCTLGEIADTLREVFGEYKG